MLLHVVSHLRATPTPHRRIGDALRRSYIIEEEDLDGGLGTSSGMTPGIKKHPGNFQPDRRCRVRWHSSGLRTTDDRVRSSSPPSLYR